MANATGKSQNFPFSKDSLTDSHLRQRKIGRFTSEQADNGPPDIKARRWKEINSPKHRSSSKTDLGGDALSLVLLK